MGRQLVTVGMLAAILAAAPPLAAQELPQERIDRALARAQAAGIPVALLESKIAEGKAKGVSLERIAAVIERRQAVLARAGTLLRGRSDLQPADLSVTADALESGVGEDVVTAVADLAPRERRVVAIAALTHLVDLGHLPEAALDRVREALKRGPEVLANLAAEGVGRQGGGPPESVPAAGGGRGTPGPPAAVPGPGEPPGPSRPGGPSTGRGGGRGQP
jgi:hypothetical protein